MTEKTPPKDEALEAIDFIINVLKEHEKDLDKLVGELGSVANQIGEAGELNDKVEKIEAKITGLQGDMSNIITHFAARPPLQQVSSSNPVFASAQSNVAPVSAQTSCPSLPANMPLLVRCKQWEDFQGIAAQAQTVSFTYDKTEQTFQAEAIKNSQLITFNGDTPKTATLLKAWISKQLEISEQKIIEGQLTRS
ncbi:MAG: hypothetical protein NWF04_03520 [Candidatus Bathyarchaeota archaeon]|nr:hypothetical protein [Candidatus Bathyarchaeota archaeon]